MTLPGRAVAGHHGQGEAFVAEFGLLMILAADWPGSVLIRQHLRSRRLITPLMQAPSADHWSRRETLPGGLRQRSGSDADVNVQRPDRLSIQHR